MNWFEQENQKEQVGLLFGQFVEKYIRDFWNPYVALVACQSRANMEVFLSLIHKQPRESLEVFAEQLKMQGENPLEWCILVVLKEFPADVPNNKVLPQELVSEGGNIKIRIHVEIIPGLEIHS